MFEATCDGAPTDPKGNNHLRNSRNDISIGNEPVDTNTGKAPAATDPEAATPDAVPQDAGNRALADEEGPF